MAVQKLAWFSAVVETRGKMRCVDRANGGVQLFLQVQSSRIAVVERLGQMTKTVVTYTDRKELEFDRRPCADHCTDAHSHVRVEIPPMALWAVSGVAAAIVLDNLIPYTVANNDQLRTIVGNVIGNLPRSGQGRPAIDLAIVRLRQRGWRIPDALWPQKPAVADEMTWSPLRARTGE